LLDRQIELGKAQGLRGLATRFFGPIDTLGKAELALRDACFGLLGLAAIAALSAFQFGMFPLAVGVCTALPALILVLSRARVAAAAVFLTGLIISFGLLIIPFGLLALGALLGICRLAFAVALLFMSARASRAAFRRSQFLSAQSHSGGA
jgi:hypothetical protein